MTATITPFMRDLLALRTEFPKFDWGWCDDGPYGCYPLGDNYAVLITAATADEARQKPPPTWKARPGCPPGPPGKAAPPTGP